MSVQSLTEVTRRDQAVFTAKAQDENFKETKSLCQQILAHLDGTGEWRNDNTLGSGNYRLPKESRELPSDGFPGENTNVRVQNLPLIAYVFMKLTIATSAYSSPTRRLLSGSIPNQPSQIFPRGCVARMHRCSGSRGNLDPGSPL